MKKKKLLGISLGIIAVIIIITLSIVGNYFYNLALNPNTPKDIVFGTPEEAAATSGQVLDVDISWLLNDSNYTDEYITSQDCLKLHSYQVKNQSSSNKWVITVHGYTSEGINMSSYAKKYYDNGYNVLIPDLRSHGLSEGDYIGMGWDDRLDIIDWINNILEDNPSSEIILHGTSMGAATVLSTSGENLPNNVKAIIADCGYTSVWNEFTYQLKALFNLPAFPVMNLSNMVTMVKAGYSLKDASPIEQVAKSKTPILYIHGDKDDFVPYYMMDELYKATSSEKSKLTVQNAGHGKADLVNPDLYWNTVTDFLGKYISN